jgi:hypothetical protein
MTEEEFQAWRHHPVTQPFLKFLHDVREEAKETWASGHQMSDDDRIEAKVYGDLLRLEWDSDDFNAATVAPFYAHEARPHYEEEEKTNAE